MSAPILRLATTSAHSPLVALFFVSWPALTLWIIPPIILIGQALLLRRRRSWGIEAPPGEVVRLACLALLVTASSVAIGLILSGGRKVAG